MRIATLIFVLLVPGRLHAQDSTHQAVHQVGFNAAEFLKFFEEEAGAFTFQYRLRHRADRALRAGLNYAHSTREDGGVDAALRLGYDYTFKTQERWRIYAGIDLLAGYEHLNSSQRNTLRLGGAPLLGLMFFVTPHFSLSTEPHLSLVYHRFRDSTSFSENADEQWITIELEGIGQLSLSIHF